MDPKIWKQVKQDPDLSQAVRDLRHGTYLDIQDDSSTFQEHSAEITARTLRDHGYGAEWNDMDLMEDEEYFVEKSLQAGKDVYAVGLDEETVVFVSSDEPVSDMISKLGDEPGYIRGVTTEVMES